ncbi:MAG: hypothetical protein K0S09_1032 [Sphingobacteriaceae bacterium]|nr:hypothetical protein [Sphingobacteriaceae bacterium]
MKKACPHLYMIFAAAMLLASCSNNTSKSADPEVKHMDSVSKDLEKSNRELEERVKKLEASLEKIEKDSAK